MHSNQTNFYGLGIAPILLDKLDSLKFVIPTPIQRKAIPVCVEGKDIVGIAQTGTGKTLAFCLPMLQHLAQKKGKGLVLVPTRELAVQVNETYVKFAPMLDIKTAVLIGGEPISKQLQQLRRNPRVLISTPGRLIDHIERRSVNLSEINILVLDEADRMLDMGFLPQIEEILKRVPKQRQTMFFSATMPTTIVNLITKYMNLPVVTEIAPAGTTAEKVSQEIFVVDKDRKPELLVKILGQYTGTVLLFTRTKIGAHKVAMTLRKAGFSSAEIHSDRNLRQRQEALAGFKTGKHRILVATDIAARGIDVKGIELVLNYDLPDETENYVHRIGRTGRAGMEGHAISFATPDQGSDVRNIERMIKMTIALSEHPEVPSGKFYAPVTRSFKSQSYYRSSARRFGQRRR